MFPVNLCMGPHMPNKAKTFITVLVSKIEPQKILVNPRETIAKVKCWEVPTLCLFVDLGLNDWII